MDLRVHWCQKFKIFSGNRPPRNWLLLCLVSVCVLIALLSSASSRGFNTQSTTSVKPEVYTNYRRLKEHTENDYIELKIVSSGTSDPKGIRLCGKEREDYVPCYNVSASEFGELVADPVTKELLHYTEKPETFVSDLINCGVYIFTPEIFHVIQDIRTHREDKANMHALSSFEALRLATKTHSKDFVRLDQDILSPLAGKKKLYTYETMDFWEQIKTPAMSLKCSALYLAQFRHKSPGLLAHGDGTHSPTVRGDVYIHPSAKVHPTAKIGENVSISANVRVAAGVRLMNCIILDDAEIQENAFVSYAIVGWKSSLGKWARVQGDGDYKTKLGITILAFRLVGPKLPPHTY